MWVHCERCDFKANKLLASFVAITSDKKNTWLNPKARSRRPKE